MLGESRLVVVTEGYLKIGVYGMAPTRLCLPPFPPADYVSTRFSSRPSREQRFKTDGIF